MKYLLCFLLLASTLQAQEHTTTQNHITISPTFVPFEVKNPKPVYCDACGRSLLDPKHPELGNLIGMSITFSGENKLKHSEMKRLVDTYGLKPDSNGDFSIHICWTDWFKALGVKPK